MPRSAVLAALLLIAASVSWALALVFVPSSLDEVAAAVLAVDLLAVALVAVGGLLITRSVWARRTALAVAILQIISLGVLASGWLPRVAAGLSFASVIVLGGPWLRPWVERPRSATAPPAVAVVLALGLLAGAAWLAVASWDGLQTGTVLLAVLYPVLAWAYGRTLPGVVWAIRFGLIPASVLATLGAPTLTAVATTGYGAVITLLAWTRNARLAADAPPPIPGTVVPLPRQGRGLGPERPR